MEKNDMLKALAAIAIFSVIIVAIVYFTKNDMKNTNTAIQPTTQAAQQQTRTTVPTTTTKATKQSKKK